MDIYIMDENFESVAVIDSFESFIWTDRYNAYGDCEIFTSASVDLLRTIKMGYYLWQEGSEHVMIVDERVVESDVEGGAHLRISGSSLEKILDRRIVWTQTIVTGNFQNAVERLLNDAIINPTLADRKIDNFVFEASDDPRITEMTIDTQFTGNNLYETIKDLCMDRKIGFKIILNEQNQFVFSLYMGEDRSYDQETNPYVIFSPNYDNVVNSNYLESDKLVKNVGLVAGEGEGAARRTVTVGEGSGFDRREQFIDARDVSSSTEGGGTLPPAQYNANLTQRGNERMAELVFVQTFEGDVETTQMFVYEKDFFLGDIVQIANEFEIEASARIEEIIFSNGSDGVTIVPTFSVIS